MMICSLPYLLHSSIRYEAEIQMKRLFVLPLPCCVLFVWAIYSMNRLLHIWLILHVIRYFMEWMLAIMLPSLALCHLCCLVDKLFRSLVYLWICSSFTTLHLHWYDQNVLDVRTGCITLVVAVCMCPFMLSTVQCPSTITTVYSVSWFIEMEVENCCYHHCWLFLCWVLLCYICIDPFHLRLFFVHSVISITCIESLGFLLLSIWCFGSCFSFWYVRFVWTIFDCLPVWAVHAPYWYCWIVPWTKHDYATWVEKDANDHENRFTPPLSLCYPTVYCSVRTITSASIVLHPVGNFHPS